MASGAKLPFTKRRRGFHYLYDDEDVDEISLELEEETLSPSPASVSASSPRKSDSDSTDGQIQMPNRAKLFQSTAENDVIDFLPREKHEKREYLNHDVAEATPAAHIERDYDDMGVRRKDVPPTPTTPPTSISFKHAKEKHPGQQRNFVYEFGWFEMIVGIGSILVFFADFGTDINLCVQYFLEKKIVYGSVSVILTAGPSLVTCLLGLHWYILDYRTEQKELEWRLQDAKRKDEALANKISGCQWALRFVMTALQFGPVIRVGEYLYYGYKSSRVTGKQKVRYHNRMLYEDVDACLLRLFESFLESAPQLTWQLYVWIDLKEEEEDVVRLSTRIFTLLSSWLSLAISLVSYHRSLRYSREEKKIMSKLAVPFYFIWRATEVGNRVLCICLFASTFHAVVFVPVGIHWFLISIWLMCQNTKFYQNRALEVVFNIICGYVMIFCFLNLKEGHTRFRYLLYYFVFYTENFAMLGVFFIYSSHFGEWFHVGGLSAVLLMAGLHIGFQLMYYTCCHPTGNIETCLPCDKNTCFEHLFHDLGKKEETKNPLNIERTFPESDKEGDDFHPTDIGERKKKHLH